MGGGYSLLGVAQFLRTGNRDFGAEGYTRAAAAFRPADLDVDLRGRRYVVTGANAGIGRATVEALAARGATVHLVCRNRERGAAALAELRAAPACRGDLHLHVVDVSLREDVTAFAADFNRAHGAGGLDGLVNNAGVLLPVQTFTREGLDVTLATMVMQTHLLTGLLAPVRACVRECLCLHEAAVVRHTRPMTMADAVDGAIGGRWQRRQC